MAIQEISFSTKYVNQQGLDQLLCIRGDSLDEVLSLAGQAIQRISQAPGTAPQAGAPEGEKLPVCPIHGKSRVGQYGVYCPAKNADGSWCSWKPGKNGSQAAPAPAPGADIPF